MKEQGTTLDEKTILDLLTDLISESHYTRQFIEKQEKVMAENDRINTARSEKLSTMINSFENKYKTIQVTAPKPDLSSINEMLDIRLSAINQSIEKGPKPVTRQIRLLLFPETNAGQYYKIVFGRLIPWALIFIVVIRLFALAQNYFADRKAKLYNQQGNQCISAWNEVYAHQNRSVKKAMDKAFLKAAH